MTSTCESNMSCFHLLAPSKAASMDEVLESVGSPTPHPSLLSIGLIELCTPSSERSSFHFSHAWSRLSHAHKTGGTQELSRASLDTLHDTTFKQLTVLSWPLRGGSLHRRHSMKKFRLKMRIHSQVGASKGSVWTNTVCRFEHRCTVCLTMQHVRGWGVLFLTNL